MEDGAFILPCTFYGVSEKADKYDVLERFVELEETLVAKLDKGLVEDSGY